MSTRERLCNSRYASPRSREIFASSFTQDSGPLHRQDQGLSPATATVCTRCTSLSQSIEPRAHCVEMHALLWQDGFGHATIFALHLVDSADSTIKSSFQVKSTWKYPTRRFDGDETTLPAGPISTYRTTSTVFEPAAIPASGCSWSCATGYTTISSLVMYRIFVLETDSTSWTPLHIALMCSKQLRVRC